MKRAADYDPPLKLFSLDTAVTSILGNLKDDEETWDLVREKYRLG